MSTSTIPFPNGAYTRSTYGAGNVVYRVGALVCLVCTTGTWYNSGANGAIRKDSTSANEWILEDGFRPVDEINFLDSNTNLRMRVKTNGEVVCNSDLSTTGKVFRFSVCFISDPRF